MKNSLTGSHYSVEPQRDTVNSILVQNIEDPRSTEVLRNDDDIFDVKWEPGLLDLRLTVVNNLRLTIPNEKLEPAHVKSHLSTGAHTHD